MRASILKVTRVPNWSFVTRGQAFKGVKHKTIRIARLQDSSYWSTAYSHCGQNHVWTMRKRTQRHDDQHHSTICYKTSRRITRSQVWSPPRYVSDVSQMPVDRPLLLITLHPKSVIVCNIILRNYSILRDDHSTKPIFVCRQIPIVRWVRFHTSDVTAALSLLLRPVTE